jgi:pimeloyl-ACP methyl ester carboxylesterase
MGTLATGGLLTLGVAAFGLLAAGLYDRATALSWVGTPFPPGRLVPAKGTRLYVRVQGKGSPSVVIETALGSPSAEWWHIQDQLAETTTVVTYDRAGYGWSRPGTLPRSSHQIVTELHSLLKTACAPGPYVLVGHSQGGLYAQLFGRLHPDEVAGAVFLDPVSSDDQRFKAELKPDVYRLSGIDRAAAPDSVNTLRRLGLMRPLRSTIQRRLLAHQGRLPAATQEVIWQHYALNKAYKAAMSERQQNETPANSSDVRAAGTFPRVPVKIIYHSPRRMVREMTMLGGLQRDDAEEVESIWQQLVRAYLKLSPQGEWIVAPESGHYIHLDQPDLVVREIRAMIEQLRAAQPLPGRPQA